MAGRLEKTHTEADEDKKYLETWRNGSLISKKQMKTRKALAIFKSMSVFCFKLQSPVTILYHRACPEREIF